MANSEIPSFNAPIESSKQSTLSKKCLYNKVLHPDQVPNFQFKEAPIGVAEEE